MQVNMQVKIIEKQSDKAHFFINILLFTCERSQVRVLLSLRQKNPVRMLEYRRSAGFCFLRFSNKTCQNTQLYKKNASQHASQKIKNHSKQASNGFCRLWCYLSVICQGYNSYKVHNVLLLLKWRLVLHPRHIYSLQYDIYRRKV